MNSLCQEFSKITYAPSKSVAKNAENNHVSEEAIERAQVIAVSILPADLGAIDKYMKEHPDF